MWPADTLVGVRPLFDLKDGSDCARSARFEVIRSNANGDLLAGQKLKLTLVREHRDYRWTYDNESGWHFDYTDRYENTETRELDVRRGQPLKFDVPVEWGNYRVEMLDPSTGLTTRLPFFAGWSWNDDNRGKEARPDKVKLALDKTGYRAGDTLKVTITPPQAGPGVLLVEIAITCSTRATSTPNPARVRDSGDQGLGTPRRLRDRARVPRRFGGREDHAGARGRRSVRADATRAASQDRGLVEAPQQMKTGRRDLPVTVKRAALAGKKAYVTVSAVDVGILNITRFARCPTRTRGSSRSARSASMRTICTVASSRASTATPRSSATAATWRWPRCRRRGGRPRKC